MYFEAPTDRTTGHRLAMAKLIPDRGAWMEFETRKNDYLILKFNRKRTVPITIFLRALAAIDDGLEDSPIKTGSDEEIMALFQDVDNNPDRLFIPSTFRQEPVWDLSSGITIAEAALLEFFKRMRPGDPATLDNARQFLEEQLFDQRHYDLEKVGRYKLNQKLDLMDKIPVSHRNVTRWDVVYLIRRMIMINNEKEDKDDIDHLGNRRVKTVGELIQNKLRIGLRRMERVIKERMSIRDQDQTSPVSLINIRPWWPPCVNSSAPASYPSLWIRPIPWLNCVTNVRFRLWALAVCAVSAPVSMFAMCTIRIMAVSAQLKPRRPEHWSDWPSGQLRPGKRIRLY